MPASEIKTRQNTKFKTSFINNLKLTRLNKLQNKKENKLPLQNLLIVSLVVNVLVIASVIMLKNNLPPEVPLFYGMPKGSEQLAMSNFLILPSAISMIFIFVNVGISYFTSDEFIKNILIATGVAATIFSSITTVRIIFLIGSF